MRDNEWLAKRLEDIWASSFPEVKRVNNITITFRGNSKNRFGSISKKKDDTIIAINSFFRHEIIPEFIIDTTIAHELVHYMHGFFSLHEKKYRHPHKGGIVTKELRERGLGEMLKKEKYWVKNEWWKLHKAIVSDEKIILPDKDNYSQSDKENYSQSDKENYSQ